jgi:hypothetical protein
MILRTICVLSILFMPLLVSACGEAQTGMDVRKPPKERPDIDAIVEPRGFEDS